MSKLERWVIVHGAAAVAVYSIWALLCFVLPTMLIIQRILLMVLSWAGGQAADHLTGSKQSPKA
jgi:hypothetical protein